MDSLNLVELLANSKSTAEFAKVKAGLQNQESLPVDYLGWLALGLVLLVLLALVFTSIRKRRRGALFRGWTSISEPHRIAAVFQRAVARQARCTMEIFDHRHGDIYRGHVFDAWPGDRVILELDDAPSAATDFEGFPAQVHLNFRPGPKEPMEHYQFSSHTLGLSLERERDWRVARVSMAWPKSLISAQRRDFLRLEPKGEHALNLTVKLPPGEGEESGGFNPELAPAAAEGAVLDISVGGIQLAVPGRLDWPEDRDLLLTLELPLADLELELPNPRLHLLLNPLYRELPPPPPEEGQSPDEEGRTIIRGNFVGRYRLNPGPDQWTRADFGQETFQDLTHWIHAYQRYILQKEKGLAPITEDRINIYPAIPPARPGQNPGPEDAAHPIRGDDSDD